MGKPEYCVVLNSKNYNIQSYTSSVCIPVPNNTFTSNTLIANNFKGFNTPQNGTYQASASSIYNDSYDAFNSFTYVNRWASSPSGTYSVTTGEATNLTPTITTTGTIDGEWLQIKLPYILYLTSYDVKNLAGAAALKKFYILGSNTGNNDRSILDNRTQPANTVTYNYGLTASTGYRYYRLIANSNYIANHVTFQQWNLYGFNNVYKYSLKYAIDWTFLSYAQQFNKSYSFACLDTSALTNNLLLALPDIGVISNNLSALASTTAMSSSVVGIIPLDGFQSIYKAIYKNNSVIYCSYPSNNIFTVVLSNMDGTFPALTDDYVLILYFERV